MKRVFPYQPSALKDPPMYRRTIFIFLFVILISLSSCAKEYDFKLRFEEGDVQKYVHKVNSDIATSVMSIPMNIKQKIEINFDQRLISLNAQGERKLQITLTRIKMDMNLGFLQFKFDSDNPDSKFAGIGDMLRKLINRDMNVTIDSEGNVTSFEGLEELLDSFAGTAKQDTAKPNFGSFMTKDFAKGFTNISYFPLPPTTVKVGDTWTKSRSFSQLNLGEMTYKETLTLEKVEDSIAYIHSVPEVSGDILKDEKGIEINGFGSLKAKSLEMEASYEFDLKKGLLIAQVVKSTMSLEGANPNYGSIPITINSVQETDLVR